MKRFALKRITALVLALVMTLSLLPVSAFAAGTLDCSSYVRERGITFFSDFDGSTLSCDNTVINCSDASGGRILVVCGEATATDLYVAVNSSAVSAGEFSVTQNGSDVTPTTPVSDSTYTWMDTDLEGNTFEQVCSVYKLSATNLGDDGNAVEYTITSWGEDITLTYDFAPIFSGSLGAMECGIAIFTKMENGTLGYRENVEGHMGSATVVSTGNTEQTVYLATNVYGTLAVGGTELTQMGTWFCAENDECFKVYEFTAAKLEDSDTVTYSVTNGSESFPLTFDFSSGARPFVHEGVEVYTTRSEGVATYENWESWDGLEIVATGPNGEGRAVGVYYTPGETKRLFLKTVDSNVTLSHISNGGLMNYSTLGAMEEDSGVYELLLSEDATGNGNVWVEFGSGGGIDFMFMEQGSSGNSGSNGQQEMEYPLLAGENYDLTFRGDIDASEPYGLRLFVSGDGETVEVTGDYNPSVKGKIGRFYFEEGSGFKWDTTGATDTEGFLEVRHDNIPNTVYRMKVTLNTGRDVFTYQGVDIYTSYDYVNNELGYGEWNYDDLELAINGGGGVSLLVPTTATSGSAELYLKPATGYMLTLPDHRKDYTTLSAANSDGVYVMTLYQLDRNTSVLVSDGTQIIGEIDIIFSDRGGDDNNGNMDKFYTTSRGNSLIRVRLSYEQSKVVSLPDSLNEKDELIVTVHNVADKEVWRPLLDDNMNLAVCYEFDELNVAENPSTATLPDVFHMSSFDYGNLEEFIDLLERDVANGATFDTYNQFGSTRQNGNFFAWASSNPGDITILPTDRDDTYGWVFRHKNADGSYSYAYDGFVMKFVLEEGADEPIVLEEIKYPAVAADRVAFVPNYASAHVNLEKVLSISEYNNGIFTYTEDGVLNYVYKGAETTFQGIQDDVLAAAKKDGFVPDEWGVLHYDLLNVTAPAGYTAKELWCSYYKQSFGGDTMTLRYHWRGASTDLDFLLTWVDDQGNELVEKITIRMPKVEGGEKWMDLLATPVEVGRVEFTQPGADSGAMNSYTANNLGVMWTQYDNDEMVDVDAVLASTVRFLAPTIDGKTATHYQLCYYGDGSDDPTLNLNNEWLADRIGFDSSYMEVVDGGTHPERIRGLLKQTYGEYDEIVYYYSADRHTRGYFVRWHFGDGVEPVTEYIQLDTSSYFCQWKSEFGKTDANMPSVSIKDGEMSSDYAFLLTRIHPQKENGKYFFELSVVDDEGNTSVIDEGDTFRIILPYSFMGVDTNGEAWTYKKVLAAEMKDPIINHYDDAYKKLQGNKGAVKGTFTEKGIEFVVDSFSPFMLTWNDPNAPKEEAQLYIGYENQNGFEWQERANCPLGRGSSSFKLGFKINDTYAAFTESELEGYEIKCSVGNITYDENGVATWNISGVATSTFGTLEVITGSTIYRAQMVVSPGHEPMFLVDEHGAHSGTWADGGQTHTFKLYADMSGTDTITPENYEFTATNAAFSVSENGDAVDVTLPFATRGEEYGYLIAVEKNSTGETTKKYQFEITAFNDPFRLAGAEIYTTMSEEDGGILLGYNDWSNFDGLRAMENGGGGTSVVVPFESGEGKTVYIVMPDGMTPNASTGGSVMPTITPVTGVTNLYKVTLGTDVTYSGGVWIEFVDDEGNNREGLDMIFDCGDGGGNGPMGSYGVEIFTSYHDEYGICYDRPDWGGVCGGDGFFTVSSTPGEADVLYLISESELSQPSDINTADGDGWEEVTSVLNADDSRRAYKMTIKAQNDGAREVEVPVNESETLTFTFRFDAFCYLGGEFYTKMTGNAEDGYTLGYAKAPAEFDYLHVYYDEQDNNMMLRLPYEPGAEATVYVKAPSVITDMKIEGGGLENIATISKVATFDGYNCFAITLPEGSNENGGVVFVQSYVSDGKAGNFLLCFMPNGDAGGDGGGRGYPTYDPPLFMADAVGFYKEKININVGTKAVFYPQLPTQNGLVPLETLTQDAVSLEPVSDALAGHEQQVGTFTVKTDEDGKSYLEWDATNATANRTAVLSITYEGVAFKMFVHTNEGVDETDKVPFDYDIASPNASVTKITIDNKDYYLVPVMVDNENVIRGGNSSFNVDENSANTFAYTIGLATTKNGTDFTLVTDSEILAKLTDMSFTVTPVEQNENEEQFYEGGSYPLMLSVDGIKSWTSGNLVDPLLKYNPNAPVATMMFDKSSSGVWEIKASAKVEGTVYSTAIYKWAVYKNDIFVDVPEGESDPIGMVNTVLQELAANIGANPDMDLNNTQIVINLPGGDLFGIIEVPGVVYTNPETGEGKLFPDVIICGNQETETVLHGGIYAENQITDVRLIRFIGAGKTETVWREEAPANLSGKKNYAIWGDALGGIMNCAFTGYDCAVESTNGTRFGGNGNYFYDNNVALCLDVETGWGGNLSMREMVFAHNTVALKFDQFDSQIDLGIYTTYQNIFYGNGTDAALANSKRSFFMPSNVYDEANGVQRNFTGHVYGDPYYLLSEIGRSDLSITNIGTLPLGVYDENWIQRTESGEFIKVFPANWKVPVIYANADDYVIPANELKKGLMTIDVVDNREEGTNEVVATMKMKPATMRLMGLRATVAEEVFNPLLEISSESGDKIFVTMDAVPSGVEAELTIPCAGWSGATVTDEEGYEVDAIFADGAVTFSVVGGTYIIYKKSVPTVTAPVAKELTYTGEDQALVTGGTTTGGTLKYSLNGETYSTDIPTGKDAKTYTVWYKVEGDNYNSNVEAVSVEVTITKADATVTAPVAKELTYTGSAQELITAGSTADGTLKYSLNGETYSTDIPTGTDAGTYTVYYKVVGDANHNDVAAKSVTVTISKAAVTVTADNKSKVYGESDPALTYSASGLVGEEKLSDISITRVNGESAGKYVITAKQNDGANSNYEITFVNGTLTVEQKEIGIEWGNTDLTYSGEAQAPTATATGAVNGDVLTLTVSGEQTNASTDAYTATVTAITGEKAENYSLPSVATAEFTIAKAMQEAPEVTGVNETIFGKNDGKITDVTNAMEYSVDGNTYTAIADGKLENLAPATYYVRYAETENRLASDVVTVVIAAGKKVTVTFAVNGGNAIEAIKDLAYGDKVTAPTEPEKVGYTFGGWFSDEVCTKAWDFDKDTVSADVTLYAKWNAIPVVYPPYVPETPTTTPETPTETKPTTPAQPVAPPAEVTVPVSGEENTINVEASVSGSTATIDKVDMTKLEGVIGDDVAVGTVTIDFSDLESSETIDTVEIPSEVVKEIAEAVADPNNDAESLEIILSDGASIEFDAAALAEKVSQAGGADITISIKQAVENVLSAAQQAAVGDRVAFDINVTSGGVHISDMGGKITIHAPYELRDGETAEGIVVYYVDDEGNREKCETSYDSAKKRVNWKTDHLSVYMIAHEAPTTDDTPAVDNTPADDVVQPDNGNSVGLWIGVALAVLVVAIIVVVILIKRKKA